MICAGDRPIAQHHNEDVVAVGEDVGGDDDALADCALDGKAAAVDGRLNPFDDGAPDQTEIERDPDRFDPL